MDERKELHELHGDCLIIRRKPWDSRPGFFLEMMRGE